MPEKKELTSFFAIFIFCVSVLYRVEKMYILLKWQNIECTLYIQYTHRNYIYPYLLSFISMALSYANAVCYVCNFYIYSYATTDAVQKHCVIYFALFNPDNIFIRNSFFLLLLLSFNAFIILIFPFVELIFWLLYYRSPAKSKSLTKSYSWRYFVKTFTVVW